MFQRKKQEAQPEHNHKVITQEVITQETKIKILGTDEWISFGQIMRKYADGIVEYGTFDDHTGDLLQGMRVYPKDSACRDTTQRYEKGRFKNGILCIGQEYELVVRYGETNCYFSTVVLDRLKLRFSYDSDYREDMLHDVSIDGKLILKAESSYMRTEYLVNEEVLKNLHKYLPALKEKECASLKYLKRNYLRRSSDFVKALYDLVFENVLGRELSSAPMQKEEKKYAL